MQMSPKPPIAAKVVIIGDSAVGKTSLRNRFLHNHFTLSYRATIGADFVTKTISIGEGPNERRVSLAIWDTAGQERFQSLGAAFYRGADACVLVFSATSQESLDHIPSWFQQFIDRYPLLPGEERDICWVAVANKSDVYDGQNLFSSSSIDDENNEIVDPNYAKNLINSILPPQTKHTDNTITNNPQINSNNNQYQNNLSSSTLTLPPASAESSFAQQSSSSLSFYSMNTTTPQHYPKTRHNLQPNSNNFLPADPAQSTLRSNHPDDIRGRHNNRKSYLPPSVYHTPSSTTGGIHVPSTMSSRPDRSRHSSTTFTATTPQSPPSFYSPAHSQKSSSSSLSLPETLSPSRNSNASTLSQRSYNTDIYGYNNFDVEFDENHTNDNNSEFDDEGRQNSSDTNQENGPIKLFFTSAKSGSNVDEIFTYIAHQVANRIENEDHKKFNKDKNKFKKSTSKRSLSSLSSSSSFDLDDDDVTPHASPHQEYLFHSLHSRRARNNSAFQLSLDNNNNGNNIHNSSSSSSSWKSKCC